MRRKIIGFGQLLSIAMLSVPSSAYSAENDPTTLDATLKTVRAQYKNAILGMSLTDWRNIPFPEVPKAGNPLREQTVGICSSFPKWTSSAFPLAISEVEKASGVVTCAYYTDYKIAGVFFGSSTTTGRSVLSIGQSRQMDSVDYYFYQDQLFRIVAAAELDAVGDVIEGLTARFGASTVTSKGSVQNKAGATFEKITAEWKVGPDTIILNAPGGGRVDKLTVTFLNQALAQQVLSEVEKLNPAASKM